MEKHEELKSKSPFSKKALRFLGFLMRSKKKKKLSPEARRELIGDEELNQDLVYYLENEIPKELLKDTWTGKTKSILPWLIPTGMFLSISVPSDGTVSSFAGVPHWNTFVFKTLPVGILFGTMGIIYGLGKKPLKIENVAKDALSTCAAISFAQLLHDQSPLWWIANHQLDRYILLWKDPNFPFAYGMTGQEFFLMQWMGFIPILIGTFLGKKGIDYLANRWRTIKKEEKWALAKLVKDRKISLDDLVDNFDSFKAREDLIRHKRAFEQYDKMAEFARTKKATKYVKNEFKKLSDCYRKFSKHVIKCHKPEIEEQREFWQEQDEQIDKDDKTVFKELFGWWKGRKLYNYICEGWGDWEEDKHAFGQKICNKIKYKIDDVNLFLEKFYKGEKARDCLSSLEPLLIKKEVNGYGKI